jgi:hypothetical protein
MADRTEDATVSDEIASLRVQLATTREALMPVMASLAAAISLLERGGKKAAPSDKMFEQMLKDYRSSLDKARAAFTKAGKP